MREAAQTTSETIDRDAIAALLVERLAQAEAGAKAQWSSPAVIRSVVIDDVLPDHLAHAVARAMPAPEDMIAKISIRERKWVAAQMDRYDPLLEEIVFAFQHPDVMDVVRRITRLEGMEPDAMLYAGGISAMPRGAYLRPHLDNSHDAARERYRVLNLLYYVTPGWEEEAGGSLQLWDQGPRGAPRTVGSRFNRLVLMATDRKSWHSVNEVLADGVRYCVSNYYFSKISPEDQPYFHATSFRAEHGTGLSDVVMRVDNSVRTTVLKLTGETLFRNPHRYERPASPHDDA